MAALSGSTPVDIDLSSLQSTLPVPSHASLYHRLTLPSPHVASALYELLLGSLITYCSGSPSRVPSSSSSSSGLLPASASGAVVPPSSSSSSSSSSALLTEQSLAKIEALGYSVGYRLLERVLVTNFTKGPTPVSSADLRKAKAAAEGTVAAGSGGQAAQATASQSQSQQQQQQEEEDGGSAAADETKAGGAALDALATNAYSYQTNYLNPLNQLDVIKFICKDYWIALFGKQVDKLQTNHRGVFVLKDYDFLWLKNFGSLQDRASETARPDPTPSPDGPGPSSSAGVGSPAPPGLSFSSGGSLPPPPPSPHFSFSIFSNNALKLFAVVRVCG